MPEGFLWGSASAAYLVEGAYLEDWYKNVIKTNGEEL